jgi:hypothetical protein
MNSFIKRVSSKTPPFFKKVRNLGLLLVGVGVSITTGGVAMPAVIVTYAGYLTAIGTTMAAIGQLPTLNEDAPKEEE